MKLAEIIHEDEYFFCEANVNTEIEKIATCAEDVTQSTLLIIPNKERLPNFFEFPSKPLAIACDDTTRLPENIPKISLKNTRMTLSHAFYRFYKINTTTFKTIAITGTNGKTSTATFIKSILLKQGVRVGYIGTGHIESAKRKLSGKNYSMTTPDVEVLYPALRIMADDKCDVVIMEVSSHALALEKVSSLFFDYALFTNFSNEHSDFHVTKEAYYDAKCKLFSQCKNAIFNIDDPYVQKAISLSKAEKNITVGVLNRGHAYATHIENLGYKGLNYLYHSE